MTRPQAITSAALDLAELQAAYGLPALMAALRDLTAKAANATLDEPVADALSEAATALDTAYLACPDED